MFCQVVVCQVVFCQVCRGGKVRDARLDVLRDGNLLISERAVFWKPVLSVLDQSQKQEMRRHSLGIGCIKHRSIGFLALEECLENKFWVFYQTLFVETN